MLWPRPRHVPFPLTGLVLCNQPTITRPPSRTAGCRRISLSTKPIPIPAYGPMLSFAKQSLWSRDIPPTLKKVGPTQSSAVEKMANQQPSKVSDCASLGPTNPTFFSVLEVCVACLGASVTMETAFPGPVMAFCLVQLMRHIMQAIDERREERRWRSTNRSRLS